MSVNFKVLPESGLFTQTIEYELGDPTGFPVWFMFTPVNLPAPQPGYVYGTEWIRGTWVDYSAVVDVTVDPGVYDVLVKVDAGVEVPVMSCGIMVVI